MKRIFALMLAVVATTAIFAQGGYGRRDSRDVVLGQGNRGVYNDRNNDGYFSIRERDQQIDRIRRQYDWKIESVRRDRYLRNGEKRREIRALENERDARIREVMERYRYSNERGNRSRRY